jgi:hypothetical protein
VAFVQFPSAKPTRDINDCRSPSSPVNKNFDIRASEKLGTTEQDVSYGRNII